MKDANGFLAITGVNINFNNVSGILSNANQQDLYNMSVANGSKQNLYEFMGYATTAAGNVASTIGSIVVINPTRDLNLPDYLSVGSVGQFDLQLAIKVKNNEVRTRNYDY